MTKHEVMKNYVEEKVMELSDRLVSFNFSDDSIDGVSFLTNYSGKTVKKYVRAADKEYRFTILMTWHFSTETDDLNLQAMNFAQEFMDWIEKQNKDKNFPDFGEKCQVKKIENLQNMPNLAAVDWENMKAQYMIQCRVLYFEKGE
ncbi:Uncharacterised protein [[Eubacterium] contortum]|uniref:Uncharacterized protein n=1 Tax=Faecalicatena contorta TaxID=39482 RepID=A0A174M2J0_9FIRM|nr:hypothetical protein [Faecalicatena contorta]CUP28019.1 Uncharacterised protein [[Eubacterium] contortum] [Faecalicatena contorta]